MQKHLALLAGWLWLIPLSAQTPAPHDLYFDHLPTAWDEGIPLGNGMMGCLVWQRDPGKIRLALDRADLWDLRPVAEMKDPVRFRSAWVQERLRTGNYAEVQKQFDLPYERDAGPSKIPAAALELEYENMRPVSVRLDVQNAVCVINFAAGERLSIFINADGMTGHWQLEHGRNAGAKVKLVPPAYVTPSGNYGLHRLGYPQGTVSKWNDQSLVYTQPGWGGFYYEVALRWRDTDAVQTGVWSIAAHYPDQPAQVSATEWVHAENALDFEKCYTAHKRWWAGFWEKSAIHLPDNLLEKQWYLEQYKFGSASRKGAPPISLQAVWTADNGELPPWKGDFHNDLNTQLSYWSGYGANHVEEARVFTDWLWNIRPAAKRFAAQYFEAQYGLNVPGVCTLTGEPMGGWIQYAFSATASAWLSQHFWWDWKYTRDGKYFEQKGVPWIKDAGSMLVNYTILNDDSLNFELPLSTSPEMHDNTPQAYFRPISNYDLALTRYLFKRNYDLAARDPDRNYEAMETWDQLLDMLVPPLDTDATGLTIAPGHPLGESHRHFSHLMAIYPLGLLRFDPDSALMTRSVRHLERLGTDAWTGYSFAWMGCLEARIHDGDRARHYLRDFARAFCSANSFHLNGDQTKSGLSNNQSRTFTLEGNFAFAAGIQEMLLQSYDGIVRVFPAVPTDWKDVSFEHLRAEGALLVSARMEEGRVVRLSVVSEKGGLFNIWNPRTQRVEAYNVDAGGVVEVI